MSETNVVQSGGVGLGGLLFVLFLALRLTDQIDWAWYWVAAPLWIPLAVGLGLGLLALLVAAVAVLFTTRRATDAEKRVMRK